MKKNRAKGKTLEKALENLGEKLNRSPGDIEYRIIKEGKKYLFGLFTTNYIIESIIKPREVPDNFRIEEALKISEELDGFFSIDYRDGYAELTVYPPGKSGTPVDMDNIINRLKLLNVENISEDSIKEAIEHNHYKPVRVADWPGGETLNAYFKLELTDNKMTVNIITYPPKKGGQPLKEEDIHQALNSRGIVYGILNDTIKELVEKEIYFKTVTIARGKLPEDGEDAYISYKFKTSNDIEFKEDKYGRVDFRELNLIGNIKKGEIAAEKVPPTKGIPGTDVFGNPVKARDGDDIIIKTGGNVIVNETGDKAIAEIDGQPFLTADERIKVEEILNINGNINYETGNINFLGTVIIEGRIEDNFEVKATGDIIIKGTIGKSRIEAGGNIIVEGGILGKGDAIIKAEKSVFAKFIENANVFSCESVNVEKIVMHSTVSTKNNVLLTGDKGALIGGITRAGNNIIVKEVGAISSPITRVEAGVDAEIIQEFNRLEEEKIEDKKKYNKIELGIKTLEKRMETTKLSRKERGQLNQLRAMLEVVDKKINKIEFEILHLKRNYAPNNKAYIRVDGKVYSGTKISVGKFKRSISREEIHVRFGIVEDKITILPY